MKKLLVLFIVLTLLSSACAPRPVTPHPGPQVVEESAPSAFTPTIPAVPLPELNADDNFEGFEDEDAPDTQKLMPTTPDEELPVVYPQSLPTTLVEIPVAPVPTSATTIPGGLNLSFPRQFAITRPTQKLTTSMDAYFITGTSDPTRPVYFGDTEINRQGTQGVFGVHVQLNMGDNVFRFRQGDQTATVTITRTARPGVSPINRIQQDSMFPAVMGGVKVGESLMVECTAPSGGVVTASFGGQTVQLQQTTQANAGMPVTFRGSIPVSAGNYPADETTKIGKVAYTLQWGGSTQNYSSTGDVYVAGQNSDIAVIVTNYMGFLYSDPSRVDVFREQLAQGSVDYARNHNNKLYALRSGGFLPVEQARILTGRVNIGGRITGVSLSNFQKSEIFAFSGTTSPAFFTNQRDGTFALTLYNTNGTPGIDLSNSKLFTGVTAVDNGGSVTYTFNIRNNGSLWGYRVYHDGGTTYLRCAYKPNVRDGTLSGVTVVLDPGHGGHESGALSITGQSGPNEAIINLAHAFAAKEAMESMGATVLLTHTSGGMDLDDRLKYFDQSGADIFISIHHNSIVESADANNARGLETYFHTPHSKRFSDTLTASLTENLGRLNRGSKQSYYRVTLSTHAPSVLLELGFISNPLEFERATDAAEIRRAGNAIAQSVVRALA